jgi:hypothetical protein
MAGQEISRLFRNRKANSIVFTWAPHWTYKGPGDTARSVLPYFFKIRFNVNFIPKPKHQTGFFPTQKIKWNIALSKLAWDIVNNNLQNTSQNLSLRNNYRNKI